VSPATGTRSPTPAERPHEPNTSQRHFEPQEKSANLSVWLSVGVHLLGMLAVIGLALFTPKRSSTVPVFELVSLNPPKLRPLRPKTLPPPETPPPEASKTPEAPKLVSDKAMPTPKKPEPKVVRETIDSTLKTSDVAPQQLESQPQIVSHVPSDPRLAFWANRVKKKAEMLWNPPTGLAISGRATAVVSFKVSREGVVSDETLTSGTGNNDLDVMALQTIQRMERVPPLPENFPGDEVQVSYEFVYKGE